MMIGRKDQQKKKFSAARVLFLVGVTNIVSVAFVSNYYRGKQFMQVVNQATKEVECPEPPTQINATTAAARQEEGLPTFLELLIQSGSDKYFRHHYETFYAKWFEQYRSKPGLKMVEIGADAGKSLDFWSNYFTDAALILGLAYGVPADLEDKTEKMNKVGVIRGDQGKKRTMDLLKAEGPFDIILDDGSHVPQHELFSLFALWNSVLPGGMYIIEDLETHYWKEGAKVYGYPLKNHGVNAGPEISAIAKVQQLIHVLNRHQIGANDYMSVMPGDDLLCSVEFAKNTLVLRKCTEAEAALKLGGPFGDNINHDEIRAWVEQAKASNPSPDDSGISRGV